ncbi:transglycosylase domain-containing protein [Alicyclobacillus vulcanalis]|uniref:Penicillin-binding protein, 1A family n=1 Tax=Alicyclobacillus vulcanalis TaxID=252246 RepID=A0A1N7LHB1_9BACL|nr:PBP1A family penicillin-binding protein [Alicyclobacillus vulcanalis]SIS73199.1 penicillin-binding protein, 1A family [Alicyclobacillus vulcanalis]
MPKPFIPDTETRPLHRGRMSFARIAAIAFGSAFGAGFIGTSLVLVGLKLLPLPATAQAAPTQLTSEDGRPIALWSPAGQVRTTVPLRAFPHWLVEATLATEDANFYRDHAISVRSTLRAIAVNVRHGEIVQGGSTITQQLAKNLYLTQDRTFGRKVREALLALQLELHEPKNWILDRYLNVVYYGHGAYGAPAASQLYFGKPVQSLDLAESAMLAGLPKGPTLYSPLDHPERAKARQKAVLERMVATGYITKAQADAAMAEPLHIARHQPPTLSAPYFSEMAFNEAKRMARLTDNDLDAGYVRIHTTLDPLLQKAAERAIQSTLPPSSGIQAALVALDPETGAIRALVGGRDYRESPFNRALGKRQPGSTFKAFVYGAALEHGWTPAREVDSKLTTFIYGPSPADEYIVHDYGDIYAGRPLTLREAIARSDNVYAVQTELAIGTQNVVSFARRLGIDEDMKPYPSLALGVFPVTPVELAAAYATFANGGYKVTPHAVESVDTPYGRTVHPLDKTRVISPELAFQMTDLMQSVLAPGGTGYGALPYLHGPAAAKTGTTDTDAWMVGYTPRLVVAVWVGYDSGRPLTVQESHLAAPIWGKLMGTAQAHLPGDWYKPPSDLEAVRIDPLSGALATPRCGAVETDYFLPGTAPTATCPLHRAPVVPEPAPSRLWNWLKRLF